MPRVIALISDSTGETAEYLVQAVLAQFQGVNVEYLRFRFIDSVEKTKNVLEQAQKKDALVICTLVNDKVRVALMDGARELGIEAVDLLGNLQEKIRLWSGVDPLQMPGLLRKMDDKYFQRIKAIEFAIKCDDGKSQNLLPSADLVILGVSRSGKTPLSIYLANKGYKVANLPLVPEVQIQDYLWQVMPSRCIGLLISPKKLVKIRKDRLRLMGLDPDTSSYAQEKRIYMELNYARDIMIKAGCRVYDTTDRSIEEISQNVLEDMRV